MLFFVALQQFSCMHLIGWCIFITLHISHCLTYSLETLNEYFLCTCRFFWGYLQPRILIQLNDAVNAHILSRLMALHLLVVFLIFFSVIKIFVGGIKLYFLCSINIMPSSPLFFRRITSSSWPSLFSDNSWVKICVGCMHCHMAAALSAHIPQPQLSWVSPVFCRSDDGIEKRKSMKHSRHHRWVVSWFHHWVLASASISSVICLK